MDKKCLKNELKHRLTAPFTPKNNGMVERVNETIKTKIILKTQDQTQDEMKNELMIFLIFYDLHRRHSALRKELNVKTLFQAIEKWYQLKPEIFTITPDQFKNKILNLNQT